MDPGRFAMRKGEEEISRKVPARNASRSDAGVAQRREGKRVISEW
jgi:hypothetical protein